VALRTKKRGETSRKTEGKFTVGGSEFGGTRNPGKRGGGRGTKKGGGFPTSGRRGQKKLKQYKNPTNSRKKT